ncbi:MAG: ATP-binding cassette domain-containing protein [Caldilineaceae bacterium]
MPDFINRYAFELSGGMRQRVAIAMAMVTDPDLIILDEPTSALDMLTQANIMNTLKRIKNETSTSFILITHDIATSSELADRAVMYAGQMVEFRRRLHLFTAVASVFTEIDGQRPQTASGGRTRIHLRPAAHSLLDLPTGCRFADCCTQRLRNATKCRPLVTMGERQRAGHVFPPVRTGR